MNLEGRVALVTGSTTGLGKAMAHALARAGATVALNYANNEVRALRALAEFEAAGTRAMLFRSDVSEEQGVQTLVSQVSKKLGPIDILIQMRPPISRNGGLRIIRGRITSGCWIFL